METTAIHIDIAQTADCCIVEVIGFGYAVVGQSKRNPEDQQDDDLGLTLAAGRAIRQLGRELLHDANRQIKENWCKRMDHVLAQAKAAFINRELKSQTSKDRKG